MKHALTIAACLLCFFLETAHAQQSGTYTTYVAGKAAVVDQWTATIEKDGTLKTEAALGAPGAVASQRAVTVGVNHRPISFTLLAGENKLITADFNGATVKLRIQNQPERELPTKATMVLENLLWHQFVFLLDQYDELKGGQQSFVALLPSQALDYPITMERVGTPDYQAAGKTIKTRRYHLVANNAITLDMWTDEARVPLLFFSAAQQLRVVRQGGEDLAETALANAPKPAAFTNLRVMPRRRCSASNRSPSARVPNGLCPRLSPSQKVTALFRLSCSCMVQVRMIETRRKGQTNRFKTWRGVSPRRASPCCDTTNARSSIRAKSSHFQISR